MNILITGINGFIGSSVAKQLIEKKHNITGIVRKNSDIKENTPIDYIIHDFSNPLNTTNLPKDFDCILHLAATMDKRIDEQRMFLINTKSTLDLLDFGKKTGLQKFIFASSGGIYGYSKKIISEKSRPHPIDFYGQTKIQSEQLVNYYNRYFSTINLRLFFPYGLRQKSGIVPRLATMIKSKQEILIYNNMNPKINPIHISDVSLAIENSLKINGKYTMNVCGDDVISVYDLALLISEKLNIEPQFTWVNDKKIKDLIGSNELMKKYLKTKPKIHLKQGIAEFLNDSLGTL